ncbi:hypothetical protein NG799_29080 [Laspinema sp. D1]|uniref:Uncharacterized protein n=1 Tax=Laspinema palackyanum D2a TaxID=2953684 RepID=A0ABT2N412_9CYAN|nr:hypothetical protein [Laspinema sp. D2a]
MTPNIKTGFGYHLGYEYRSVTIRDSDGSLSTHTYKRRIRDNTIGLPKGSKRPPGPIVRQSLLPSPEDLAFLCYHTDPDVARLEASYDDDVAQLEASYADDLAALEAAFD